MITPLGRSLNWRQGVFWLAVIMVIGITGAVLFAASGIYNVSALEKHYAITKSMIRFVLNRSIATHSPRHAGGNLDNERLIRLGARHFQLGCAPCHGTPDGHDNPVMQAMNPAPPALSRAAPERTTGELSWIIENGIKFTGMPAWAGLHRQDEIRPLVAFLRHLPNMDGDDYESSIGALASPADRTEMCIACHGDGERPPVSAEVPSLSGQTSAYLQRALLDYRADRRQSGMMEPLAAELDDPAIARLAAHFAEQRPPDAPLTTAPEAVDRGRRIAEAGRPDSQLPPCLSCHGSNASERFPRLTGLSRQYIVSQLRLFRSGIRDESAFAAIMSTVAQRLTPQQIDDVAAYFAAAGGPAREFGSQEARR